MFSNQHYNSVRKGALYISPISKIIFALGYHMTYYTKSEYLGKKKYHTISDSIKSFEHAIFISLLYYLHSLYCWEFSNLIYIIIILLYI